MPSPFPGMDPYLESHWLDVHGKMIVYACDQLAPQLPRHLYIRTEEYLAVGGDEETRGYYPDIQVRERQSNGSALPPLSAGATAIAVAEPMVIPLGNELPTLRSLRIYDKESGNRLVTAVEFLSPANKTNEPGRKQYRKKQQEFLEAGVSLVEIDLIRVGEHMLVPSLMEMPPDRRGPYRISVVRGGTGRAEVYKVTLRERLPAIRIPLRPTDPDAALDLQPLLDRCYDIGAYEATVNYRVDPVPLLQGEDAVWADELLRAKGKR